MFKKGQKVNLIGSWDRKGRFYIQPAIVFSCGAQRMVLTNAATGDELGKNYKPQREQFGEAVVVPAGEDAEATAMEMAEAQLARRIPALKECVARNPNEKGYVKAVEAEIAELLAATPSFFWK